MHPVQRRWSSARSDPDRGAGRRPAADAGPDSPDQAAPGCPSAAGGGFDGGGATDPMSYDLYLLPLDRALTWAEASAELDRLDGGWRPRLGHDGRLDPFLRALRARYPGIGRGPDGPPVELDIHHRHVFLAIGWSDVESMVPVISALAFGAGLTVVDPQREVVGPPSPLAAVPLGPEGLDEHVRVANEMLSAVVSGAVLGGSGGPEATHHAISEQLRSLGATAMSPLGFEITPEVEAEVFAHPDRVPASLQTRAWRDELIAAVTGTHVGHRHRALGTLGGWGSDPVVATALRPLVVSDDVWEAGQACAGLARQGDITDLPAVLDAVRRFSPAEGGSADAMLAPLRAALDLAQQAGPEIVAGVKGRARGWRGSPARRRAQWEGEAEALLDGLLAD